MLRAWVGLLTCGLVLWAQPIDWQRRETLRAEDLRSVSSWFQKKDSRLKIFTALAKQPLDSGYSVLVAEATLSRDSVEGSFGVFVVYGQTNQVYMVLDIFPKEEFQACGPAVEDGASGEAIRVHFFGDYGLYRGSLKYVYDLKRRKPASRVRYNRVGLVARTVTAGTIQYATEEGCAPLARRQFVVIRPSAGELPEYRIIDQAPCVADLPAQAPPIRVAGTLYHLLVWKSPPGYSERSGVYLISESGHKAFHPVPVPDLETFLRLRPDDRNLRLGWRPAQESANNEIGPFALDGTTLWFGNDFYAGEGFWGVGAIGSFDVSTREYTMRYLPEIAPWAASAILLDGDDLWIGLFRRPEGVPYGGGVLRWNRRTGAVVKYTLPDVVHTIDRLGDTLYFGTSYGLYTLRGSALTLLRFEPGVDGRLTMAPRAMPAKPEVGP